MGNVNKLYNNIIKDFSEKEIGNEKQFETAMKSENNVKKLYDALVKKGYKESQIGNYDTFSSLILPKNPPITGEETKINQNPQDTISVDQVSLPEKNAQMPRQQLIPQADLVQQAKENIPTPTADNNYTIVGKPRQTEYPKEQPSWWESFYKGLGAGIGRVGGALIDIANIASSNRIISPNTFIDPYTGMQLGRTDVENTIVTPSYEEKLNDKIVITNPDGTKKEVYRDPGMRLAKEVDEWANEMSMEARPYYGEKDFLDLLKSGEIGKALQLGLAVTTESAIPMLVGSNPIGRIFLGTTTSADHYAMLREEMPDMPEWKRVSSSIGAGVFEQFFESKGVNPVKWFGKKGYKQGMDEAEEWAARMLMSRWKKLGLFGKNFAKDVATEGLEEVATSASNDALNSLLDLIDRDSMGNGIEQQYEDAKRANPNLTIEQFALEKARSYLNDFIGGSLAGAYMGTTARGLGEGYSRVAGREERQANEYIKRAVNEQAAATGTDAYKIAEGVYLGTPEAKAVIDRANEMNIEDAVNTEVDAISNNGNIISVTDGYGNEGVVVKGNIEFVEGMEGQIDRNKSDEMIYIRNQNGKTIPVPAKDLIVLDIYDAEAYKQYHIAREKARYYSQETFKVGDNVYLTANGEIIRDEAGNPLTSQVTSVGEDGSVNVEVEDVQGNVQEMTMQPEEALESLSPVAYSDGDNIYTQQENKIINNGTGEVVQEFATKEEADAFIQGKTDVGEWNAFDIMSENKAENEGASADGQNTLQENQTETQQNVNQAEQQTPSYPLTEDGEPDFSQMTAEQSIQVLDELGDQETIDAFIANNLSKAKKSYTKAEKMKPKSTSFQAIKAEQQQIMADREAAKAKLDLWSSIKSANDLRKLQRTSETLSDARLAEQRQARIEQEKAEKTAEFTGKTTFKESPKIEGNSYTRTLPDGTKIRGKYTIVPAESLIPSHDPNNNWETTEGFPTVDGVNVNDRDYKNDAQARQVTEQMAANYGGQAIENVPVVSSDGVVYDGNGRTIAGQIAAQNGTDAEYIQQLTDNAANYGFTPEQIASVNNPRLVLVLDEDLPYNTETFAKFNAQEKKTQSTTEKSVAAGKRMTESVVNLISDVLDSYSSIESLFGSEKATADLLKVLQDNGIIQPTEIAGLTENGLFSAAGREYITSLVLGSIFSEDAVRRMGNNLSLKNGILRAVPAILENRKLGEYSLIDEINEAITLLYEARANNMALPLYLRQTNAFEETPKDKFSEFSQLLASQLDAGVAKFRELLDLYNNAAKDNVGGQQAIFGEATKEDIKQSIIELYGKRRQNQETGSSETETVNPLPSVQGSERTPGQQSEAGEIRQPATGEIREIREDRAQEKKESAKSATLLDVVRTLYTKGKEAASKLFQRSFFDVAQTPKFMKDLGLRGDKFTIKYGVIARHLDKDGSHALTEKDWSQLPNALQNPFAISKLDSKEDSYRIYTTVQTDSGEFVVVGADVKNAGRDIEVNAISTVFGRRNNANLPQNEEVIYRSDEITPEQSSLLERPNFAQYPTEQELSIGKDSETTPNLQADNISQAESEVNANPTEAQKEEGQSEVSAEQLPTQQVTTSKEKIEDVGEKIGGAKKDKIKEYADKIKEIEKDSSDILSDIAKLPLSKIYNFDYDALRKEGVSNEIITLLETMKKFIPSKPRTEYKLRRWANNVFSLYSMALRIVSMDGATQQEWVNRILSISDLKRRYDAYMSVGGFDSGINTGGAGLLQLGKESGHYDSDGKWKSSEGKWYVNNAGKYSGIYDTKEDAVQALKNFSSSESTKGEKKIEFSVYTSRKDGKSFITIKGKPSIVIQNGFDTARQAIDYVQNNYNDLVSKYSKMKEKTEVSFNSNRERQGKDWRSGKDVTAEEFRSTFGFRGVEFGNWANQRERQDALNRAFDALMDLSEAIGKSPRSLSLNGELAIAFGARGSGRAAAHYEPSKTVINLTKTQGAGSLAHEWWHAVDNYFAKRRGEKHGFNTEREGYKYDRERKEFSSDKERKEVTDAFKKLVSDINASDYGKRSSMYAELKSNYWKSPTELGARAFASWVERKLSELGIVNDYLSNNPIPKGFEEYVDSFYPYPLESDFDILDNSFDNLFNTIQEKIDEETGKVILFNIAPVSESIMTESQKLAFDAVSEMLGNAGIPVEVMSDEQMQQLAGDGEAVLQASMGALDRTARTIRNWVKRGVRGKSLTIDLPVSVKTKIRNVMGRDFDSHNITSNSLVHILNNHGEGGKKLSDGSIPLREEDLELIPYIMVAPDRVEKSSTDMSGRESVRFYKDLSNGYVVVVEKEYKNSPNDMETITMWAEKSSAATNAQSKTAPDTLVRNAIRSTDVAKIRKDAETAMADDIKSRLMTVYHGSGAKFDSFDHNFMGTGEGAQAYGWGSYVTEVKEIGKTYAESTSGNIFRSGFGDFYLREIRNGLAEGKQFDEVKEKLLAHHAGMYEKAGGNTDMYGDFISDYETLQQLKESDLPKRNLYTVEIPDNDGKNYLDWEKEVDRDMSKRLSEQLFNDILINDKKGSYQDDVEKEMLQRDIEDSFESVRTGKDLYKAISLYIGEEAASKFLSRAGFVGISYPAQYTTGGRSDNARNYVIFNEEDLQIKDRISFMKGKKKASETVLPEDESSFKGTVVSDADGTKVLNNLDNVAKEYDKFSKNRPWTFLGDVAKALSARQHGSKSQYATFETVNGQVVTIRLSDHNASTRNFDNAGRENGISIVISRKPNQGITNDGNARLVEFFYPDKALQKAEGKPLAEIVRSIKQALYSGEYTDTTGLAEIQEVNADQQEVRGGVVYGATVGGKIYMNGSALNPETPIHEYTHIWDNACRKNNPELWNRGVELMKQTPVWEEVKNDPNYSDLNTDDEIASEVHSRLTGRDGSRILEDMAEQVKREGTTSEISKTNALISKLKKWLSDFWYWVKDTMTPWTKEEASRVSLEDFINMPLKDLAQGRRLDETRFRLPDNFGETATVPINYEYGEGYYADGVSGYFVSEEALLDAFRNKYPAYVITMSEDGESLEFERFNPTNKTRGFRRYANVEYNRMRRTAENLAQELGLDVEIIEDVESLEGKKRYAKGWYDVKTKKIYIVFPNATGSRDVARTILHEGVAHYNLREMLGENFDLFLDNIYSAANKTIKSRIDGIAEKQGISRRIATEEYLAMVAEDVTPNDYNAGWFSKVKASFLKLLEKLGINLQGYLTDNDFKYIVWRSYDNLKNKAQMTTSEIAKNKQTEQRLLKQTSTEQFAAEHSSEYNNSEESRIIEESKANGTYMKAPNGRPTNLTERQWAQVRTKAFKDWFGDWENDPENASKVVDENGEPRVIDGLYLNIRERNPIKRLDSSINKANNYVNKISEIENETGMKWDDISIFYQEEKAYNLLESIVSQKDYIEILINAIRKGISPSIVVAYRYGEINERERSYNYRDEIFEQGISVVGRAEELNTNTNKYYELFFGEQPYNIVVGVYAGNRGADGEILLTPATKLGLVENIGNIIKSATDNTGEFDPNNPDIRFRMADEAPKTKMDIATESLLKAGARKEAATNVRLHAMKAIGKSLRDINKAIREQAKYSDENVSTLREIVDDLMRIGELSSLDSQDIRYIFSKANQAVTKSDLTEIANGIVDRLMDATNSRIVSIMNKKLAEAKTKKNEKVAKASKMSGYQQITLSMLRELLKDLPTNAKDKYNKIVERYETDETLRMELDAELEAYEMYFSYLETISPIMDNIKSLNEERDELLQAKKGKRGNEAKSYRETINEIDKAIVENKADLADALTTFVNEIDRIGKEGRENKNDFSKKKKARKELIRKLANFDLSDIPAYTQEQVNSELKKMRYWQNSGFANFLFSPLNSLNMYLKLFGRKHAGGKGYLFNYFEPRQRQAMTNKYVGMKQATEELNKASIQFTGMDFNKLSEELHKKSDILITYMDGGKNIERYLTHGQALYLYMINKMSDGAMKLRKMGISEEDIENIASNMDSNVLDFADWIQNDFLPKKRAKYNKVHMDMFGVPMARIENYFPIRIAKGSVDSEKDINKDTDTDMSSTITGAIIKRTANTNPIDLTTDALSALYQNIDEMEDWAAYAQIREDFNTLINYRTFRNRLKNMKSVHGSGDVLYRNFVNAVRTAVNKDTSVNSKTDRFWKNISRGTTVASLNFNLNPAIKQILGYPAIFGEADLIDIIKNTIHPYKSFKWAMENLPLFEERVSGGNAGWVQLELDKESSWEVWNKKYVEWATKIGMAPNRFMDAIVCAATAKAAYDTSLRRYKKWGFKNPEEKALADAERAYNETQPSSQGLYISPMQRSNELANIIYSLFRNANFAFYRRLVEAVRNLSRISSTNRYNKILSSTAHRLVLEEGFTEEHAEKVAREMTNRQIAKDSISLVIFGYVLNTLWSLGSNWAYLLAGDDDDEKKKMIKDALIVGLLSPITGIPLFGSFAEDWMWSILRGSYYDSTLLSTPLTDEIERTVSNSYKLAKSISKDDDRRTLFIAAEFAKSLVNLCVKTGIGINPDLLTNMVYGVINAANSDFDSVSDFRDLLFTIINAPAESREKLIIDELGITEEGLNERLSQGEIEEIFNKFVDRRIERQKGIIAPFAKEDYQTRKTAGKEFKKQVRERVELKQEDNGKD